MVLFDLLYFLVILLTLPLWARFAFTKRYRTIIKHRLIPGIRPSKKKRIWIHAVSVGEVRSIKSLIEKLQEKYKDKEIVLSVTTPSGFHTAKEMYPFIPVINAPVDLSFTIRKFIKAINPQLLVLNELEVWPNWIRITHRKKIPILLINGRISDTAFRRYQRYNFFLKQFFTRIDRFLVQAEIYKEKFLQLQLPPEKIRVCGNIKADEAVMALELLPPERELPGLLQISLSHKRSKKIVSLASSHAADEALLAPVINRLKKKYLLIIVPRHLNRVTEIEALLKRHDVAHTTWSRARADTGSGIRAAWQNGVLIYDRMGYLFHVLKISDIVFMGGTMEEKIGGHNFYEPAILGKPIVGGPWINNFPAIGEDLSQKGVYHTVNSGEALAAFLENPGDIDFEGIKAEAVRCVSRQMGSLHITLEEIDQWVG